ncbi:winged helix-turn-helix domain-containing protein [Candidatus Pelagibacter sp.]|nr:winged helix-turn-helix domain-containing protein [Candidatus Pelagibacter sp.]
MHSQKLHILNIPELNKIIIEIKDYLNYEILYFNEKKDLMKKIDGNKKFIENSIILVNQKDFSLLKSKIDEKQIHCIKKFPIKISNLIDQLNARLIQQNYSAQSNIIINKYMLDINSRVLKKSNNELKLTEREIDTIIFLKNENKPAKVDILQKKVWKYNEDLETHTVETHIYRLRKKIKDTFNDDKFIQSKKDGYIIDE